MNKAFDILQKHHDYKDVNGETPSEYNEDRILEAMEEYANYKIDFINSSLQFNASFEISEYVKYKGEKGKIVIIDLNKEVASVYFSFMDKVIGNIPFSQLTKSV